MVNSVPGSYHNYKCYWEEITQCYASDAIPGDQGYGMVFEDYCNVAYDFSNIEGGKLVAPMWAVDDLFTYVDPVRQKDLWSKYIEMLIYSVYMPISLCSHHVSEGNDNVSAVVYFNDCAFSAAIKEYPHMSSYDYYFCLDTGRVVNPFSSLGGRRPLYHEGVFDLDDFINNQYIWTNATNRYGYKPMDVRMYIYTLTKKIKTRNHQIRIKAQTLQESMHLVAQSDKNALMPLSYELQKALIVKMIVTNPYVSCNLLIV